MIQRIQSVYLLLSLLAIGAIYFFPLAQVKGISDDFILSATGIYNGKGEQMKNAFPISVVLGFEIIFTLVVIFLYKKRSMQMMLCKLNLLILTVLIAIVFFLADQAKSYSGLQSDILVNYGFACLFPVISIILNYLAIRAIKKDEDLVRAADRLR